MGGNFKFQVQDSFLEYFFLDIWRFEKRIALFEKKKLYQINYYVSVFVVEIALKVQPNVFEY